MGINTWVLAPTPLPPHLTTPLPSLTWSISLPPASAKAGPESAQIAAMGEGRMVSSQEREGLEGALGPPITQFSTWPPLVCLRGASASARLGLPHSARNPRWAIHFHCEIIIHFRIGVGGFLLIPKISSIPFCPHYAFHLKCSHLPLAHVCPCPSFRFQPLSDLTHFALALGWGWRVISATTQGPQIWRFPYSSGTCFPASCSELSSFPSSLPSAPSTQTPLFFPPGVLTGVTRSRLWQ